MFLSGKTIWMMVYYGLVHEGASAKAVYPFLMESLSNATLEMPYRGPAGHSKDNLRYENKLSGDIEYFSGTEKIFDGEMCVYEASYIGGLVDQ